MKRLVLLMTGLIVLLGGSYWFYTTQTTSTNDVAVETSESKTMVGSESTIESSSLSSKSSDIAEIESNTALESNSEVAKETAPELPEQPPTPNIEMLTEEGETVYLKDLLADGQPTIINIWASWCPPCKEEMPLFEEYAEKYSEDIRFIMLNATQSRPTETQEVALNYLEEEGLNLPVYFDIDFNSQIAFGARSLPTTVVIDENGDVIIYYPGQVTEATMDQFINYIIQ
ncbi:TlpA family protein disulfide reductase [Dolosicoccus paucivorans]|nr:TlpA disulfide reductase family protein [Dolosicoccus paucivorans]SDI25836.1 Thiol-disulfide isomerase or thioredoxin [Dolosicoccus paucivorans]